MFEIDFRALIRKNHLKRYNLSVSKGKYIKKLSKI